MFCPCSDELKIRNINTNTKSYFVIKSNFIENPIPTGQQGVAILEKICDQTTFMNCNGN